MNCAEARELLHAYADGELDVVHHVQVEAHVADCAPCAESLDGVQALRETFARARLSFDPPASLESNVRTAMRRADGGGRASPWPLFARVLKIAAPLAAGLVLGLLLRSSSAEDPLARELVANHVRSLMAHHLADVDSSDQHTVKPWFEGRVSYAPRVRDLSAAGFPLIGGRLDYLDGRPVAALVYKRRQHVINLFIWPAERQHADLPAASLTREGYSVLRWTEGETRYAAVSDVATDDLEEFARLARQP